MRSPRPRPCRCGTPRPRSRISRPDWVPAGMVSSSAPSSVSTATVGPRAAWVMAMCSSWCRSTPSRTKRDRGGPAGGRTGRPCGPPRRPAMPRPVRRSVDPSSTPPGTSTRKDFVLDGGDPRPGSPGTGWRSPRRCRRSVGHGLDGDHLAEDRLAHPADLAAAAAGRAASSAWCPPGRPSPPQVAQATGRRTDSSFSTPKTASVNSRSSTASASSPGRRAAPAPRPALPNGPAPPKKASNRSPRPAAEAGEGVAGPPAPPPVPRTASGPNMSYGGGARDRAAPRRRG